MKYFEKLKDPRWQKKRLEVMQRDGWKCLDCFSTDKPLQVHHCVYEKEPWDVLPKYLLTLCEECHKSRQELENNAREMLGHIAAKLTQDELLAYMSGFDYDIYHTPDRRNNA